jgi:N-ethylmaleimide reductase
MTAPTKALLTPVDLGALHLKNRVVLAPLTRSRAGAGNVPTELMAEYYTQRATGGLLISEATQVVPEGQGYPTTPGIHSDAQIEGWRRITDAVHAAGSKMVLQLWHVGRVSHPVFQPGGKLPVAPSAVACQGQIYGPDWKKIDHVTPRALELDELPDIVTAFAKGAENAKRAGFDGVEVHGANGYLLDQFLRDSANKRTDAYGGSVENRARLLIETMQAVIKVWGGPDRVGVRLSPHNPTNSMSDSNPRALFGHVAERLAPLKLAYIHVIEPVATPKEQQLLGLIKTQSRTKIIANNGYTPDAAEAAIASGAADAIAFGKLYLANPDLPRRIREAAPLNAWDQATFYGGSAKGYTDYPALP